MTLNTTGSQNTAVGFAALRANTTGNQNTAIGYGALYSNTVGFNNQASGFEALYSNTTGVENTASGIQSLLNNTTGSGNTASGSLALVDNSSGNYNTAMGQQALGSNQKGANNSAVGYQALLHATGTGNLAVGYLAGQNITTGSNNIAIGNPGSSGDGGVIRIGVAGTQKSVFVAGVENAKVTGAAVYVTTSGQLGVLASSERYKTAIEPMDARTAGLSQLRPVTFKLKTDAEGTPQYGLIAEEVAKIYPELVIRDAEGAIQGVRYDELAPMLLNELQRQERKIRDQDIRFHDLERELTQMRAALAVLQSGGERVAQR